MAKRINMEQCLTVKTLIDYCSGITTMSALDQNKPVGYVWNDSRKVSQGDVFVALSTDNDDGHAYVKTALSQGACAVVVDKKKINMLHDVDPKRLIAVKDPLKALQTIAQKYRSSLSCRVIGITGSSGKTTTRTFIAAVLKSKLTVGETLGNWNNHIGVPLSILRFTGKEQVGVLEMGANHTNEIHTLSNIAKPDIGVITNIGYAHVGLFGSLTNIAKAKCEIVDGMQKKGLLFFNGDDALLVKQASLVRQKVVFFGTSARCAVRARDSVLTKEMHLSFRVDNEQYTIPMPGRHFMYSALSAIAVAREFGIDKQHIENAFAHLAPVSMRGVVQEKAGTTFIVDCYNANPSSMKTAISLLLDVAGIKSKCAIVGDMLELGSYAKRLHRALGRQLAVAKVNKVLAVGEFSHEVAMGAIEAGMIKENVVIAHDSALALPIAKKMLKKGDTVLVKGSRGIHLETILDGL